ncbi:PEP-CTERM sorting domain-containing protein [Aquabacterium fontiphilum]|jgi:hypothetical protein|uniref:FxDxF family PEP-CTERM protein n=1 Tax=Aquabacterium fontiphilum TaxID=450365 RepID=UPI0013765BDD|nr:FxDxF family PEP-CTERM protein [Aquabacterium fontiphilum]NBD20643.1 PEP-CTERM sorting domain-containing protein [Aquabacterium fontiphilum]
MKLHQFAVAAVAAVSVHMAHAVPQNSAYLGVDPYTQSFAAGAASQHPGLESSFTFDVTTESNLFGTLIAIHNPVTIDSITLSGGTFAAPLTIGLPLSDSGEFRFSGLGAGSYTLTFAASTPSLTATYGGALSVTPVPEAQSLALALAGLGVVGLVASRRKRLS